VNGKFIVDGPGGAAPEQWDERRIGSEHDGRWLIGKIDEVRVYKRVLIEKEIANNYTVKSNDLAAIKPVGKLSTCWGEIKDE